MTLGESLEIEDDLHPLAEFLINTEETKTQRNWAEVSKRRASHARFKEHVGTVFDSVAAADGLVDAKGFGAAFKKLGQRLELNSDLSVVPIFRKKTCMTKF